MAYTAKADGAWLDKTDTGGTATSNLIDKNDANRWEANMLDAHTRATNLEAPLVHAVGNSGAALTLSAAAAAGYIKTITLTANCTFTFTGGQAGRAVTLELILTQDGTGSRTVTWPASVKWGSTAPTLSTPAGSVDVLVFTTYDGGVSWLGNLVGKAYA